MTRTFLNDRRFDEFIGEWISEKVDANWTEGDVCFGVVKDGKLIGGAMVSEWNGQNATLHQRIDSPYGMTKRLLYTTFKYAFETLGAARVSGFVRSGNRQAIKLNLKLGFKIEAVLHKFMPGQDDLVVMSMWRDECRFLHDEYA